MQLYSTSSEKDNERERERIQLVLTLTRNSSIGPQSVPEARPITCNIVEVSCKKEYFGYHDCTTTIINRMEIRKVYEEGNL